jgi:type I restriction enzyme M protein
MANNHSELEARLWEAADELRANSKLKSSEYSVPVLGLIFLRYADHKFAEAEKKLSQQTSGRRKIGKTDYQAQGVLYIPEKARFATLLSLPEGTDIGKAINDAMKAIETENEDLRDVLPKTYNALEKNLLVSLLKNFSAIPMNIEGDAFGKIYEYFLGNFAMSEGQKGGEFFTPTSIVKLIVEIIEPYHGRILDPACGSGGMFVQSAAFVEHHRKNVNQIMAYGQEKVAETIRLCKMNLAVHGLSGDIRQAVTYYEDPHKSVGKFDFVMANPPFNVDKVDKERIKDDPRYPFSLPKADNANYLWIQLFFSALNPTGRAGFVMANSAGDARGSELDIRRELLRSGAVDVMVSVGSNFFYTVTLPCTLWFFDKGKAKTDRKKKVLFIDARHIFTQIDRAHREFTPQQIDLPSRPTQDRIASILSVYDDLIENNTRRIKILEQMARMLYREWFVNFRFPSHEKVKMVESELGLIPTGWHVCQLADICSRIASGGTPSRRNPSHWNPPTVDWYKTKELRDGYLFRSEEKISETGYKESSAKMFPVNTVVMAIYAAPNGCMPSVFPSAKRRSDFCTRFVRQVWSGGGFWLCGSF